MSNYIIGHKKLKRALFASKTIPQGTQDQVLKDVREELIAKLDSKLNEEYVWLASCFVAVMAGNHGGDARKNSREKLLELINLLGERLGEEPHVPEVFQNSLPERWSRHNLHYGWGAFETYAKSRGMTGGEYLDKCAKALTDMINGLKS